jgi:TonB-linked SusC/RagA family outer membrane protein
MLQHHTPKCDKFMFNLKFKHMIYLSTKVPIFLVRKCFLIMKLTAILITFLTIQSSAFVYSQETKLNLSIDNQKITQILKKIKSKTEFKFIYKSDLFSEMPVMSIHVEQATIYEILDHLIGAYEVSYEIKDRTVVFRRKVEIKSSLEPKVSTKPEALISGKVTDETGTGLPNANILIKGTKRGTVTDLGGQYQIEANPTDVLVFSYVGYDAQEVVVGNQKVINVSLKGTTELQEVVVTGFGDVSKRTFTGASQNLALDEVQIKGIGDVSQMLQGRSAGVSIQNVSGTFGAGPKITIRGSSSITGDGRPLWVIDGVVQEDLVNLSVNDLVSGNVNTLIGSSVAGLNPNDIESFEILKDASATALYGSRSLNGVIVIKTKRGKTNVPISINYAGEFTTRTIPNYSQTDILNSKETFSVLKELENKGLLDVTTLDQSRFSGVYGILANRINTFDPATGQFLVRNTPEDRNRFLRTYESANTNWFNTLFRQTITQNHTISFSGGGQNNQFYSSIGLYSDPGWTLSDKVDRISLNLRNTFELKRKAQLTFSLLGSYRKQLAPGSFNRQEDNVSGTVTRDFDINPYSYSLNTSRTLRPKNELGELEYYTYNWAPFNILNEIRNNYIDLTVQDIKVQTDFQIPLFKEKVVYAFVGSIRYANSASEHNITEDSNVAGAYRANGNTIVRDANNFLWRDQTNPLSLPQVVLPEGGILIRNTNLLQNFYIRNTLTYNHRFNEKHELNAFLGQEIRFVDRDETSFTGYGLVYSGGRVVNTNPNIITKLTQESQNYFSVNTTRERSVSIFSRFTYGFNGKYFISFTGNLNASNQQGLKDGNVRWTPTYTFSGKWNAKEESLFRDINAISSLTVRGSYGLTANSGIATNTYPIFRNFVTDRSSTTNRESAIRITDLQNDNLTWEKQFETNIGFDLGLFKNNVNLIVDAYNRNGFDLFDFVRTSGIGGQGIKLINNADMRTRGIEVSLRTNNFSKGDFQWTSTINFSAFNQEVTKIAARPNVLDAVDDTGASLIGFPRNSLFSIRLTGLNDKGLPLYDIPNSDKTFGVNFQDTGVNLLPTDGSPGGLLSYLRYEGPTDPNRIFSLQNTFTYKNWSFGFFIIASGGNFIRLPAIFNNAATFTDLGVYSKEYLNRWLLPGDEKITRFPVIPDSRLLNENRAINRAYTAYNFSTDRVADGTFVRLRSINISYRLPKLILDRLNLKNFTLSGQVTNPWLIYSDKKLNGVDPEFYNSGGVAQPITRQYTISLNIGF